MGKTKFSDRDIVHLAKLANLNLTAEEIEKYREQLSSILEYVEQLNEVDTEKEDTAFIVSGPVNVFRDDQVQEERKINSTKNLKVMEKNGNKYFKVPRIME